jgi:hypothetical protein
MAPSCQTPVHRTTTKEPVNVRRSATDAMTVSFGAVNAQRESEPSLQVNELPTGMKWLIVSPPFATPQQLFRPM